MKHDGPHHRQDGIEHPDKMKEMNPLRHPEPVRYPPGEDPVLDVPHDPEAAVDDFRRVLVLSLILSVVFIAAAYLIT